MRRYYRPNTHRRRRFIRFGAAGAYARLLEKDYRSKARALTIAALTSAVITFCILWAMPDNGMGAIPIVSIGAIMIAGCGWMAHRWRKAAYKAEVGARAEETVASILESCSQRYGWRVEHDRRSWRGNVDHVVFSADTPSLVVIETKAWQRLDRQRIMAAIGQVRQAAESVRSTPPHHRHATIHVMIALPNATVGLQTIDGVMVTDGANLERALSSVLRPDIAAIQPERRWQRAPRV